ncbi:MAG: UDP-glucose dehydrogenase family protein [Dehalococcoidia bacterium]
MSQRIAVIGVGRIGAVTAVGLAHLGHNVLGIDRDAGRVARLAEASLREREPGLQRALPQVLATGRVAFATSAPAGGFAFVFVCVDTPSGPGGHPDLSQVVAASQEACRLLAPEGILVTRSTVPVGTAERLASACVDAGRPDVSVVHNPEFVREGVAWEDFCGPDRLVFGGGPEACAKVAALFESIRRPLFITDAPTAEMAKYVSNAFLATSVSFANEMAGLSVRLGADPEAVAAILRADHRVGVHAYVSHGLGFGGHCLPKDTSALVASAAAEGWRAPLLEAVLAVNRDLPVQAAVWLEAALGGLNGKRICLAGIAFKPGTDDLRESPALRLAAELARRGASVAGFDPEVVDSGPAVETFDSLHGAAAGADALVVGHAWKGWREFDPVALAQEMRGRVVLDAPGVLDGARWAAAGFSLSLAAGGARP